MQAGDLRSRVGFYSVVAANDGYGNTQNGYSGTAAFVVSANIKPRLGGETVLASRLTGTNLVNITVRSSVQTRALDDSWKAKDERTGIDYNIRSVIDPDEGSPNHGKWIELLCEKGAAV
jgi:head-tail adaptor